MIGAAGRFSRALVGPRRGICLAMLGLDVMAAAKIWRTPRMLIALAGVVHNRQGAASYEHQHRQNDQYGGLHLRPRCCWA
jgi:hypothetical protein